MKQVLLFLDLARVIMYLITARLEDSTRAMGYEEPYRDDNG